MKVVNPRPEVKEARGVLNSTVVAFVVVVLSEVTVAVSEKMALNSANTINRRRDVK